MAHAIWTGTVGFGLVEIPVSLHSAESPKELDLKLLDRRDFSPVGYQRINKTTGKEVPWEEVVKAYEHADGEYVVLTEADFEAANVEATHRVDVLDFVEVSAIDPRYFDRPYYLLPKKTGQKAYALFRETLRRTGRGAVGKVVIRTRQHLCVVVPHEQALVLILLRFANELRDEKSLEIPEQSLQKLGVTPKELDMAKQLVEGMASDFSPERYEDDYRRDLLRLINERVDAGEINRVAEPEQKQPRERPRTNVVDLVALLKQSLSAANTTKENPKPRRPAKGPAKGPAKAGGRKRAGAREPSRRQSA